MTRRELTPADYIDIVRRRWSLILVLTLIGPPLAYGIARILPARYKSQTLVLVQPPTVSAKIVEPVDTVDLTQRLASLQQQILSRSRLEPIIRKLGLFPKEVDRISMDNLVARLQKEIEVTPVQPMADTAGGLPGFYVTVTMDDPHLAQSVCQSVTSMFIEESLKLQNQRSAQTTDFLSQQLLDAKTALDAQDAKLAAFKLRYIGSLPDQEQTNLNLLNSLSTQLDAATQALARAEQDKTFAQSMLDQQIAAWQASSQVGGDPDTLQQQLVALQAKLADLRSRYTDQYPDVVKAKADIAAITKRLADGAGTAPAPKAAKRSIEPAQITQLRAQVLAADQTVAEKTKEQAQIKRDIAIYQSRVQASPVVEEQYKELTRGYQTALEAYNDLLKKRDASVMSQNLTQQQEGEQFYTLDPANLPDAPSFPNRRLFALGGLAGGLGLGLGLALLIEMQDTSMRTERDVEFVLHLPVLATIPDVQPDAGKIAVKSKNSVSTGVGLGARA
ncbi:MAG TPA: Wzz/FepE/Etk N-terminal domain-containing protein [Terriglobales bacterium]|nr:Wzz/FepE/Etk N-terminal domain-containing protein [Terriglobales bacterium]